MFFWKKEKQIEQDVEDYIVQTEQCLEAFRQAMEVFFRDGLCEEFERLLEKAHQHEHAADDRRRDIEARMYDKSLIPESRGDVLGMLEAIDRVPNKCESILNQLWTQNMRIPEQFLADFKQLIQPNVDSHTLLCQAARNIFLKARSVGEDARGVSGKETESDRIEHRLIKAIFSSDMDTADKILLKEIVLEIGSISDRAENAADRLRIIAVKRRS